MKEIKVQSKVIGAVLDVGGAATKLSNRFLVGVSDLLIKLPRHPAALLEVKFDSYPSRAQKVRPAVTKPQEDFLLSYAKAGMPAGVMSFLHGPIKNYQVREWWLCVYGVDAWDDYVPIEEYDDFESRDFNASVIYALGDWLYNWSKEHRR